MQPKPEFSGGYMYIKKGKYVYAPKIGTDLSSLSVLFL